MSKSVIAFIISILLLSIIGIVYRYRRYKDSYYSNAICREEILNVTHSYLDENLVTRIKKLPNPSLERIKKEIISRVEQECDRRVVIYYNNNKTTIDHLIENTIVKRINKLR